MLKGTHFSVDYDYPREIQEARSKTVAYIQKDETRLPKVQSTVYPARLIKDGRLVHDELPEWSKCMETNRINQLNNIGRVNTQSIKNLQNGQPIVGVQTYLWLIQMKLCQHNPYVWYKLVALVYLGIYPQC